MLLLLLLICVLFSVYAKQDVAGIRMCCPKPCQPFPCIACCFSCIYYGMEDCLIEILLNKIWYANKISVS